MTPVWVSTALSAMQTMMVMTMKLPMEPAQTSLAVMVPDMIRAAMATRLTQSVLTAIHSTGTMMASTVTPFSVRPLAAGMQK